LNKFLKTYSTGTNTSFEATKEESSSKNTRGIMSCSHTIKVTRVSVSCLRTEIEAYNTRLTMQSTHPKCKNTMFAIKILDQPIA
jgi:hypothetical protein